jgi:signal peptidase I
MGTVGKIFKITINILLGLLLVLGLFVVFSFVPIPGNYKLFTVQSGSMEPKIHMGSLIFVKPESDYSVGDVVTRMTSDVKVTVTHRIVKKEEKDGKIVFDTKGDANNSEDGAIIMQSDIIGKEIFKLPYFGYLVGFAKTMPGIILLIIIPAVIIVYDEINKIKKEFGKLKKKKRPKEESSGNETRESGLVYSEPQFVRRADAEEAKKRKIV